MNTKKLNPLYWFRKLNDKISEFEKIGYEGIFELASDLQNKDSKLHCQKCGAIMPMFKVILLAKPFKNGETYCVKCKKCGYNNKLIKGEWYKNE